MWTSPLGLGSNFHQRDWGQGEWFTTEFMSRWQRWICRGLQSLAQGFESPLALQITPQGYAGKSASEGLCPGWPKGWLGLHAGVAQSVERHVANVKVEGS